MSEVGSGDSSSNSSNNSDRRSSSAQDVLSLMDRFIENIHNIRRLLLGVSMSAIILAPLAIGLSVYLLLHPSFFAVLEIENEFGLVLSVLLAAVIVISGIWLTTGVRQYRSMSDWEKRYRDYAQKKQEIDNEIASRFGLDHEQ